MVAAGSLRAAGGAAVAIRSARRRAAAGRAVTLTVRLRGSALRSVRRALARKRRVTASLSVVATDAAGNSRQVRVRAIVLR